VASTTSNLSNAQLEENFPSITAKPWTILNLGCGTKTSPLCINIDRSLSLRLVSNPLLKALVARLFNAEQMEKVRRMDKVLVHNLRRGIPQPTNSADAAYHSHVLEHIDRDSVMTFLVEIRRVLKPSAVHRVVVPDLERAALTYLADFSSPSKNWCFHDQNVKHMIEQSVRRKSAAVLRYGPIRQSIETFVFGDARRRGETHQWMYDRINLRGLLEEAGFREIEQVDYKTSRIPNWAATKLDMQDDGVTEYKSESLYFECIK
jgi:ubiquinone/menaquinone biosynthesis C-methylase UbiE